MSFSLKYVVYVGIAVLACVILVCVTASKRPPAVVDGRQVAVSDYDKAVSSLCNGKAQLLFEQINGNRCVPQLPEIWMKIIHPAASLACGNAILTVSEFRASPDPDLPMMNVLQPAVMDAIRQCNEKGLAKFAAETKATQKVCLDAVQILGDGTFKGLKVAYAITGKITAFAFCINPKSPGMCVAFSCRLANRKMEVERVDLIHFPAVYQSTTM